MLHYSCLLDGLHDRLYLYVIQFEGQLVVCSFNQFQNFIIIGHL